MIPADFIASRLRIVWIESIQRYTAELLLKPGDSGYNASTFYWMMPNVEDRGPMERRPDEGVVRVWRMQPLAALGGDRGFSRASGERFDNCIFGYELVFESFSWTAPAVKLLPTVIGSKTLKNFAGGHNLERFKVRSKSIGRDVSVEVLLPPNYYSNLSQFHMVFAFPGLGSPIGTIVQMANLRRAQESRPMIWISFDNQTTTALGTVNRSWGLDAQVASLPLSDWQSWMTETMPFFLGHYRTTGKAAAVGISMGTFSLMTAACDGPQRFGALVCMSGGVLGYTKSTFLEPILGKQADFPARWAAADIRKRIDSILASGGTMPPIRISVSPQESNYRSVIDLRNYLADKGLLAEFSEDFSGEHEYATWHAMIDSASRFIWNQLQAA